MTSRDHLIPSMTVDKNGHVKKVYVSPSAGTSRSLSFASMPTLSNSDGYDDEDQEEGGLGEEWEHVSDAESWIANEFDPDDAQDWEHEGFDADDAYGWKNAGFDHPQAGEWRAAGFSESDAKEWEDAGFSSDDAKSWSGQGFTYDVASEWQQDGFDDPAKSGEWSNEGFDASEAVAWNEAGFKDASTASEWKEASRSRNLDLNDLALLHERDLLAEDAPQWLSLFDTVKRLKGSEDATLDGLVDVMDGVNPSAGDAYADASYPYSLWKLLASNHIEFDKVRSVQHAQLTIDEMQQNEYGDDYEEDVEGTLELAASWMGQAEGFNRQKSQAIMSLIEEGYKPSDVPLFLSHDRKIEYRSDPENIIKAQQWTTRSAGEQSSKGEQHASFERFYKALRDMGTETVNELVSHHGADKVEQAIVQGMRSEPQLRNYLEHVPVAGISEGAL